MGYQFLGAMSLPETTLPEHNQIAQITLKPKIHTSQLIATANQKITLEVTVLEVTRHLNRGIASIQTSYSCTVVVQFVLLQIQNRLNLGLILNESLNKIP